MAKKTTNTLQIVLICALVLVSIVSLYVTFSVPHPQKQTLPQLNVAVLQADCTTCFNTSIAITYLKSQHNFNVTEVKVLDLAASLPLATQYNITRLPAIIVSGDITNLTIPNFETRDNALVFAVAPPPFYDVAGKKVVGEVSLTQLVDPTCLTCFNLSNVVNQFGGAGIVVVHDQTINSRTDAGKKLVSKYHIEKLPALLLTNDALAYPVISQVWSHVGSVESDGTLVLRQVNPPYLNVSSGKVDGLVEITYLVDPSCTTCYNVTKFKDVFEQGLGMALAPAKNVTISSPSGKITIKKYNITALPTVLLSTQAAIYPGIDDVWKQLGSRENDGTYVFRTFSILPKAFQQQIVYKNLSSGQLIILEQVQAELTAPDKTDG